MKLVRLPTLIVPLLLACATGAPCMTASESDVWLRLTSQITEQAPGPDPTIALRYVRVRGSEVAGYASPDFATHGFLRNGQEIVAIPLASGGSMGVAASLIFTVVDGHRRFVGYLPSPQGHLDVSIREGRLEQSTPIYGPKDPNCCPSRHRIEAFLLHGIRLVKVDERITNNRNGF